MSLITKLIAKKLLNEKTPDYTHESHLRKGITRIRFTNKDTRTIMEELKRKNYIDFNNRYAKIKRRAPLK